MKLDWVTIWQEFENELNAHLRGGGENTWAYQQEIIERIIGSNLTQRAPDALRCTSDNGEHYYLTYEKCVFCQHERG